MPTMLHGRIYTQVGKHRLKYVSQNLLEQVMTKRHYSLVGASALGAAVLGFTWLHPSGAQAQQYPIMNDFANKIIQKYTSSSCEQLWEKKAAHAPPTAEEQRIIGFLRSDPQMRAAFINQIAPPIANKMFDCGMIP
jgi:hypothetical protein